MKSQINVIGHDEELRKALISLLMGKHLLLEGPVGAEKLL